MVRAECVAYIHEKAREYVQAQIAYESNSTTKTIKKRKASHVETKQPPKNKAKRTKQVVAHVESEDSQNHRRSPSADVAHEPPMPRSSFTPLRSTRERKKSPKVLMNERMGSR